MSEEMTLERAQEIMNEAIDRSAELLESKPAVAELILKQVLRIDPEHPAGLQLLGLAKHRMGQNTEAIEIFQTALELDPYNADNYNDLGLAYAGVNNNERAIECIKRAIELEPAQYLFLNNLALQYRLTGDPKAAIGTLEQALTLQPDSAQMWTNLGGIYGELKQIQKSVECFNRALDVDPSYSAAHVDLAFAHHLLNDWKKGFEEYEWRFEYFEQMQYYKRAYSQKKRWNGRDSLEGKRILIYAEQGLGDCIQFIRFVPELKKLGAHVIVHTSVILDTIVKRCAGVDATCNRDIVNGRGDPFPEYDYQCSLMSLPHLLKIYEFHGEPYVQPTTKNFRKFVEEEYGNDFKIGIVWAGSPAHPHDQRRSIPLKEFKPIHDVPGVKLFSLQFDTRPAKYGYDMRPGSEGKIIDWAEGCQDMKVVDLTTMIQNMEDSCTILAGLDLVIACDTAIVHLAGAMGVPCWMLLPFNPDWRWGLYDSKTCWYDSVRIFRQPDKGDWTTPVGDIKRELETLLQNQR
jgi:tetratricopeptide (TPR) repeat protein